MTDDSPDFGQPETEPPPTLAPDAFIARFENMLLAVAVDPQATQARLNDLRNAAAVLERERLGLEALRTEHDRHIAQTTAEMAKEKAALDAWREKIRALKLEGEGRYERMASMLTEARRIEISLKRQAVRHAGYAVWVDGLQAVPGWSEIEALAPPVDSHHLEAAAEPIFDPSTPVFRVDSDHDSIDDNTRPAHWGGQPRIPVSAEIADRALDKIASDRPKRHYRKRRGGRAAVST